MGGPAGAFPELQNYAESCLILYTGIDLNADFELTASVSQEMYSNKHNGEKVGTFQRTLYIVVYTRNGYKES
jgi:hypothetical protein